MRAVRAWRQIRSYRTPALSVFRGTVRIPTVPLPAEEEVLHKLASFGDPEKLINIQALTYGHWRDVLAAIRDGDCFIPGIALLGGPAGCLALADCPTETF